MTISLAFPAPDLVKAAVEGRLPRGVGIERLRDLPSEWSWQFEALGLYSFAALVQYPNYGCAIPIILPYAAIRLRAQNQPPGTEFWDAETRRPKSPQNRLPAHRDKNPRYW